MASLWAWFLPFLLSYWTSGVLGTQAPTSSPSSQPTSQPSSQPTSQANSNVLDMDDEDSDTVFVSIGAVRIPLFWIIIFGIGALVIIGLVVRCCWRKSSKQSSKRITAVIELSQRDGREVSQDEVQPFSMDDPPNPKETDDEETDDGVKAASSASPQNAKVEVLELAETTGSEEEKTGTAWAVMSETDARPVEYRVPEEARNKISAGFSLTGDKRSIVEQHVTQYELDRARRIRMTTSERRWIMKRSFCSSLFNYPLPWYSPRNMWNFFTFKWTTWGVGTAQQTKDQVEESLSFPCFLCPQGHRVCPLPADHR